jgi:hypothetical protein
VDPHENDFVLAPAVRLRVGYGASDLFSPDFPFVADPADLASYLTRINQLLAAKGRVLLQLTDIQSGPSQLKVLVDFTNVIALNDQGEIAGTFIPHNASSFGVLHGFVYDDGTFTTVDPPGATSTSIRAINDHGEVSGYYSSGLGLSHGFIAIPAYQNHATGAVMLGDLLSSQASQGSTGDFLPGASAMDAGSSQSANAASASDQDQPTTVPFGAVTVASSPEAALSPVTDGHG